MPRWKYHVEGVKALIEATPSDATPTDLANLARGVVEVISASRWHREARSYATVRDVIEEMSYAVADFDRHIGYEIDEHEIDDWLTQLYDAGDWDRAWIG
ncbi:hypothetical protein SEA_DATBOI_140 [Gordonia phage DatBoi]|nr:hypothetical protein SEA_DATBOI_140 [Gordonia phage DatBoi]